MKKKKTHGRNTMGSTPGLPLTNTCTISSATKCNKDLYIFNWLGAKPFSRTLARFSDCYDYPRYPGRCFVCILTIQFVDLVATPETQPWIFEVYTDDILHVMASPPTPLSNFPHTHAIFFSIDNRNLIYFSFRMILNMIRIPDIFW